jgi:hypothetical protein
MPFFHDIRKSYYLRIFSVYPTGEKMKEVLLSGFEPESKPRKGLMIGRYTTGAEIFFSSPERIRTSVTGSKGQND